jgi:hypothetical protein
MKIIFLKENPLPFQEALQALIDGKCLGIHPENSVSYYTLENISERETSSKTLVLNDTHKKTYKIAVQYYSENWFLVIVDHRELITEKLNKK